MVRRPRLDLNGFHHIVNHSVSRNNIYRCDEEAKRLTCPIRKIDQSEMREAGVLARITAINLT